MASPEILSHVYSTLNGLKDGEARPKVKALAAHYGVTEQTIYRWAALRGISRRRTKSTKGKSRVDRAATVAVGAATLACRRTNKQFALPASDAIEILEDSGIIATDVTPGWFLARMRQEAVSIRDLARPAPHVRLLSDHPNHVWQFDVTNCLQYFLDDRRGMEERDEELELSKNRISKTLKSMRRELLRYAVVDHCTGAFYFRYFYASGERAIDGAQFLFEAMRPKQGYPFHGVPLMLYADRGSIVAAKANQRLFESLRIRLETHLPGNPRAKGAIEGLMKHLVSFEGRLRFKRPSSLDELNAWAMDWCIYVNTTKLMRGTAPRAALWSTISNDQLRLCPDERLYRLLVHEPIITRKADGSCMISVDGNAYRVPDTHAAHRKVSVVRHPFEYPAIEVHFNGNVWLCEPVERDRYGRLAGGVRFGEYRAPAHTPAQRAKKEMEEIATQWGLTWRGTGDKRRAEAPPLGHESPLRVFGHHADKVPDVTFIERRGTPVDVVEPEAPANEPVTYSAAEAARPAYLRRMPLADFLSRLSEEMGPVPKDMNVQIRETYPDGVPIEGVHELIEQLACGGSLRAASRASKAMSNE